MARNMFYRDFTLCKAAALGGLIGLAMLMGGVRSNTGLAGGDTGYLMEIEGRHIVPVTVINDKDCDTEKTGIAL